MKKLMTGFAIVGLVFCGGSAVAEIGTIDDVPAATLLLPYFEVDLNNPDGVDTLFSINNASAAPAIAHVTLWTDLTKETIDFSVYLTGYDVQTISVRDIFNGNVPTTAHPAADTDDLISPSPPEGPDQAAFWDNPDVVPEFDTDLGSCDGILPLPDLPSGLRALIESAHTGNAVAQFGGECAAQPFDDGIARGYITVDSVSECTRQFPNSEGYWIDIGNDRNVLWGDYFIVDRANNFAQGENLVHIEADPSLEGTDTYTFYGRWANVIDGADHREALGTTYATRYLANIPPFDGTDLIVWRDAKFDDPADATFECGLTPDWYPLDETQVAAFDEEERVAFLCAPQPDDPFSGGTPGDDTQCFPAETQRVPVTGPVAFEEPLDVPFDFGWLFLNLNHASGAFPVEGSEIAHSWVTPLMSSGGRFSVGLNAIQLDNANDYSPTYQSEDTPTIADPQTGPN